MYVFKSLAATIVILSVVNFIRLKLRHEIIAEIIIDTYAFSAYLGVDASTVLYPTETAAQSGVHLFVILCSSKCKDRCARNSLQKFRYFQKSVSHFDLSCVFHSFRNSCKHGMSQNWSCADKKNTVLFQSAVLCKLQNGVSLRGYKAGEYGRPVLWSASFALAPWAPSAHYARVCWLNSKF